MHKVAEAITSAISVRFLHIADTTAEAVKRADVNKVALLGTRYTMEQPFYRNRLSSVHGLDVRVPDERDRQLIHAVIYDELEKGIVSDGSRRRYLTIIDRMIAEGAQGLIAAVPRSNSSSHRRTSPCRTSPRPVSMRLAPLTPRWE